MPGFAAAATSSDPTVANGARDSFMLAHRILGTLVGETLGYLLTAAWTLLVLVALRRSVPRSFTALGAVAAGLIVSGILTPLHLPLVDTGNFVGYIMWSVWLVTFAILILLRQPHSGATAPAPTPSGAQKADGLMTDSVPRRDTFWWSRCDLDRWIPRLPGSPESRAVWWLAASTVPSPA